MEEYGRRRLAAGCLVVATAWISQPASGQTLAVDGFASATGAVVDSRAPWLEGSWARLVNGQGQPAETSTDGRARLELGVDWEPTLTFRIHAHGVARLEPAAARGSVAGLVEGYLQYLWQPGPSATLRFRGGLMFPGFSRENVDPLWSSPYTLTLSALNSWIGEEVRLAGLESLLRLSLGDEDRVELAATLFGGNDTSATLLAWRGFAMHSRLSVVSEVLPLPPLSSLKPGGPFHAQRDDGTRPIDELDGRIGWLVRANWSRPGLATLQAAWYDNRGDRGLHRGQYSWDTRFLALGAELRPWPQAVVAGEFLVGDSAMGPGAGAVNFRFRTGYALVSVGGERLRGTFRYDRFQNTDNADFADPTDEEGDAVTLAGFWSPAERLRLGLELLWIGSDRPAAAATPGGSTLDSRRIQLEARFSF